ncbi:MAG TPA: glycerate kinase, partial [Bacillota bacterium]|nr:glycerate kinase [Bacillota bacterium]
MFRRIVAAPDSFKGSLTAKEVAEALEAGIKRYDNSIEVVKVPMADGGEGTVQSMVDATGGHMVYVTVKGPMLSEVEAFYGILGDGRTAVIEMAAASGLPLVKPGERNPLIATSYGTGELIRHALDMGCRRIIIGIGGSATNDGGAGAMQALGVRFLDNFGNDIGFGGGSLGSLGRIDISNLDPRIKDTVITVACDVDNPL